MRRAIVLVCLFAIGCATGPNPDTEAARDLVRRSYSNPAIELVLDVDEQPEYAAIAKIPTRNAGSAACGVRVRFQWRDGNRTMHDDWLVWVTDDHKAIGWTGNPERDNWREYVRSLARQGG
jgi:hypothetical protein